MNTNDREVVFEIVKPLGVITHYPTGWNKELNLVSWNNGTAKFDIRDWNPEHEHMSRGITLHSDEAQKLVELLKSNFAGGKAQGEKLKDKEEALA